MYKLSGTVFALCCVFVGLASNDKAHQDRHAMAIAINSVFTDEVSNIDAWHACVDRAQAWKQQLKTQAPADYAALANRFEPALDTALDRVRDAIRTRRFADRLAEFNQQLAIAESALPADSSP